MWKNAVDPDRPQMTIIIWRMRSAGWITKATNTHSEYVRYFFSAATVVARTLLRVTFMHTLRPLFGRCVGTVQARTTPSYDIVVCTTVTTVRKKGLVRGVTSIPFWHTKATFIFGYGLDSVSIMKRQC